MSLIRKCWRLSQEGHVELVQVHGRVTLARRVVRAWRHCADRSRDGLELVRVDVAWRERNFKRDIDSPPPVE